MLAGIGALVWRRPAVLLAIALAVLTADTLALALKVLTDRPRPFVVDPEPAPLVRPPLDLSFPSGHAATSVAAALVITWCDRSAALPAFALAIAIAVSRVYVGVHYPLDVVGGALLGLGVGLCVVAVARRAAVPTALRRRAGDPRRSRPAPPRG